MPQITEDATRVTIINTFTVDPARTDELIGLLDETTEKAMKDRKGFLSASFHKSADGRKVANYAQWASRADFDAMLKDPAAREQMQKVADLAESFEPVLYEVVSVHDR